MKRVLCAWLFVIWAACSGPTQDAHAAGASDAALASPAAEIDKCVGERACEGNNPDSVDAGNRCTPCRSY